MTRLLRAGLAIALACFIPTAAVAQNLHVAGVLGNTAGLTDTPFPYAYYTGIAADDKGRLYLAGADAGIVVANQDGALLAVVPLPDAAVKAGLRAQSTLTRSGGSLYFVANRADGARGGLFKLDVFDPNPAAFKVEQIAESPANWALSTTLDPTGRLVSAQSDIPSLKYNVSALPTAGGTPVPIFSLDLPKGATRPYINNLQVDPDGTFEVQHLGGVNFTGHFSATGERIGDYIPGQLLENQRYNFGYGGGLRRMDVTGQVPAPGDAGSPGPEIRMARQVVRIGDRYFFAGRGGALEARWNGTNFVYTRRIGAVYLEDMTFGAEGNLEGVAFTSSGSWDVQHTVEIPREQPMGQLLDVGGAIHSQTIVAMVPAPGGSVLVGKGPKGVALSYEGSSRGYDFDLATPEIGEAGQAAVVGRDMLLADPKNNTIWRRPLLDKKAPFTAWRTDLPGVRALAAGPDGVYTANATTVIKLSPDGKTTLWGAAEPYMDVRRLATAGNFVYVCEEKQNIVDQLDAATGKRLARLGTPGQAGSSLNLLNHPHAIAANLDGVYIADNGNGRILVATTTLWKPNIALLPRDDGAPPVAATIALKPPTRGRLSLNVYDQNDLTVRQLVCAGDSTQPITWDGRDMYGKWVKPGTYKYHAILAPKLGLKYVGSLTQSGNPPYRTPDGKGSWGGVWGNVMDVCTVNNDPNSDIVVLWAFEEGEGGLIRMSQDGEVRWKQHLDWWMQANQTAVTSDGTDIYIVGASTLGGPSGRRDEDKLRRPLLWRVDAATGAKKLYEKDQDKQPMFGGYHTGSGVVSDIAVKDGKLFIACPDEETVFVADAATGKQLEVRSLFDCSGLAVSKDNHLLASCGDMIVELDDDGKHSKVIASLTELPKGGRVTQIGPPHNFQIWDIDATPDGGVAVSVGAPLQQVICFNAAGQQTRVLGAKGGRPNAGPMIPDSFRNPVGLCVTGAGKLFVAEDSAPKRFTRWSADGKLEKEFQGPYYLSGMFAVDEENPQYVYGDTHGDIIRYKFDYATGAWSVDRYWLNAYKASGVPAKWWARIRHRDGKTYWCSGEAAIVELKDDGVRGVAAVYGGWVEKGADGNYTQSNKNTGFKGTWSDLNGDGKPEPEEWQVTANPTYPLAANGPQQGWGAYFDENFDLYMHDWSDGEVGGVWKLPVTWKNGVPIYNWETALHVGLARTGVGLAHGSSGARAAFAAEGAVYAFNGGYNAAGLPGVGHGHDWEFAQITKYDPATGIPIWFAGERSPGFASPGQMYCPTGAAGIIGDYLFWTDENSLVHVWDKQHGLYVDTLLEDISRGPKPDPYTVWVELFNTRVFRNPANGKVYLMAASDAIHVYEVTGLDTPAQHMDGTFTVTQAGLDAARRKAEGASAAAIRTLAIPRAKGPTSIDGDLKEFAAAPAAIITLSETAKGTAKLMADNQNLYLACDVTDDSPWKNSGTDLTTLFKTGDAVDLWLGAEPGNRAADARDTRVEFAPMNGTNVAIAFRPKVATGAKPVTFRSPSGQVVMDKVEPLEGAKIAVVTTATGYRLEAAIPLASVGIAPAQEKIGLDISFNFSDPAGQRNVARMHWARNGAAMVYDLPTEGKLEPGTWGVGLLEK